MSREINTTVSDEPLAPSPDGYLDKLFKLIPAEISGAYLAASSLIDPVSNGGENDPYLFFAFVFLLILIPFYMTRVQGVSNKKQIAVTTVSFPIWAANVSNIQVIENFGIPGVALGMALVIWTVTIPVIFGSDNQNA